MSSISSFFSHVKPSAVPQDPTRAQPVQPTAAPTPPPAPTPAPQPLDQFKDIWTAPNPEPGKTQETPSVFAVTQQQIMEAARKTNFSNAVPQETLTAILAGGDGAVVKLQEALNSVAQSAYGQAAYASTKILERGLAEAESRVMQKTAENFRSMTLNTELRQENPLFTNPAVQPIMDALQAQLVVKYPNATPNELSSMAKQYVTALGQSFAPPPATNKSAPQETDWEALLMPTSTNRG